MTYLLLIASFALLLGGALVFTNAVEWAGRRLNLGQGAVGSILAAVATALPESLVPVVAIAGGQHESGAVAVGAIIGAPFLLATLAMALVGSAAYGFRARREQGERIEAHRATLRRDLVVFLAFFGIATLLGYVGTATVRTAAAVAFVVAYGVYVWRSIAGGGEVGEEELKALYFDPSRRDPPGNAAIIAQTAVGIGMIAFGAHLFVEEITTIADRAGIPALVLALVLAPLATELPEKFNSVIWIHAGKDSLALGNITGAMVFQSMLPVAVGLAFTDWAFGVYTGFASGLALAGGGLALWVSERHSRFRLRFVAAWGAMFVAFVSYVGVSVA